MKPDTSVPLFPLPNVILYPGAMLPLHVFEPRYVRLVEDLMAENQNRLALALLKPGWNTEYFEQPAIYSLAGIGRVVSCQRMPENRYNILIEGVGRAELTELPMQRLYRQSQFTMLEELPVEDPTKVIQLRNALAAGFSTLTDETVQPEPRRSVGYLADVLLIAAGVDISEKQRIFSILDVETRVNEVLRLVDQAELQSRRCNPPFGGNPQDPQLN